MILRRIEPTERCYKEQSNESLSTMDDATKGRDTYETSGRTVLGLAASHLLQDYPAALQSRVDGISSSACSSRRAVSTQRRTEGEAGSPRVADRSGPAAVLSSSPLVLHL